MTELLWILLVVLALVAANGIFVAAEFAILAVPRTSVEAAARKGDTGAAAVRKVLEDPRRTDRYFATAQVGITLASLGLGMYGEHALAHWLAPHLAWAGSLRWVSAHVVATVTAVAALTYLHIVVGEMVPKALALQHASRTVMALRRPMQVLAAVFFPLVVVLNVAANGVLRVFGVRRSAAANRYHTPNELRMVVEESRGSGALRALESRLIQESLEFSDLTAGEVMVPRVHVAGIPVGAGPDALRRIVAEAPHTRYPAFQQGLDTLLGVVHVRDLLRACNGSRRLEAAELRGVPFVPETMRLDEVLGTLRRRGAHMAVVMDEHGGTAGILTIEDLMEEIVGEIEEEAAHDAAAPMVRRVGPHGDRTLAVSGRLRLDELGEGLDHDIEHPRVDTVSGLVLDLLGRPPKVGDVVEFGGVRLEVTEVSGRGVRSCRATLVE